MNVATKVRMRVLLVPHVHLLDLAGPVQAFYEANGLGASYRLSFHASRPRLDSAQGLGFDRLQPLTEVAEGDWILVPGPDSATLDHIDPVAVEWLRTSVAGGARVASICSGAFVLARAGLLDGRSCTTHWKVLDRLQAENPAARVRGDRLFVEDGPILTSAGEASGIDLALSVIENHCGPLVAARVAREMVVYLRRDGSRHQTSIFLDYRSHLHPGVHKVQDWMLNHPEERATVSELARVGGMSERHLTRVFRRATGLTVNQFAQKVRLEVAGNLLHDPHLSLEAVATRCGFRDARQLRRLWREHHGTCPSAWRSRKPASA